MPDGLLTPDQRQALETLVTQDLDPARQRAVRLLLLYDQGQVTIQVSEAVGISPRQARHWRRQFQLHGLALFSPHADSASPVAEPVDTTPPLTAPSEPVEPVGALPLEAGPAPAAGLTSPGILPDDPLAEAGRKVLRFHFQNMLRHEDGVRLGEDIEELHDMRVASRRMRAAVELFGEAFTEKALKNHQKGMRQIGRALGRVRDLDVFIAKAQTYQNGLEPDPEHDLAPLLAVWETQRQASRQEMLAHLDSPGYQRFKEKFTRFVETPFMGALPHEGSTAIYAVRQAAPLLIYRRLAAVQAFEPLLPTASLTQLHALRIEFKRLRYALEFLQEALGAQTKTCIQELKRMQDHLGDLQDANVAIGVLLEFLGTWDDAQDALPVAMRQPPKAALAYLSWQYKHRRDLLATFPEAWARFDRPAFRQNLAMAVVAL